MADVEGATARVVREAAEPIELTDSLGRMLTFRTLGAVDRMKIFQLVAPEDAAKAQFMFYVRTAFSCTKIDGIPVPKPNTLDKIFAIVDRLGDEGMEAISAHIMAEIAAAQPETPEE